MNDAEMAAHFDGRSTAILTFRGFGIVGSDRALALAHHFGYELVSAGSPHKGEYRITFRLDNSPLARERAARAAQTQLPLPGQPPQRGWSPTPVHAGGTWVSPGEAATARRNITVRGDSSSTPLVVVFGVGAAAVLVAAWNLRDDSLYAVVAALVLSGLLIAAAVFAPSWVSMMKRRDAELVARYEQQQALASGTPPPSPPPPAPAPLSRPDQEDATGEGR